VLGRIKTCISRLRKRTHEEEKHEDLLIYEAIWLAEG